ncbi:hypothetical protein [Luteitalea sp. TBR-22]|uniref:post-PEP-CTERM-1 domain-containing protein n=1 Tax=Luteitalea sp. TBR-22 TaxID=2802971 RepID=UPI001EF627E4|nr:hypothetical protein [Luteitalea sp. TBR-22]
MAAAAQAQVAHSTAGERQAAAAAAAQVATIAPAPAQPQPPTAEELAAIAAVARMISTDTSALRPVVHPDGAISVDLQGTFMNIATASVGADGALAFACSIPGHDHGARTATAPKAVKPLELK